MATWASLTAEQQDQVENLVNPLRSAASLLSQLAHLGAAIGASWNGGTSTIVNSLGSTEVIPSTSGLAGAQGCVPADIINVVGYMINISDPARSPAGNDGTGGGYNSAFIQALMVKLCGINASLSK